MLDIRGGLFHHVAFQRWKAGDSKCFASPAVDLSKVPEASGRKVPAVEGEWSSRMALGLTTVSAAAFILTPATTLLAVVLNSKM